jgi:hypothetical protein
LNTRLKVVKDSFLVFHCWFWDFCNDWQSSSFSLFPFEKSCNAARNERLDHGFLMNNRCVSTVVHYSFKKQHIFRKEQIFFIFSWIPTWYGISPSELRLFFDSSCLFIFSQLFLLFPLLLIGDSVACLRHHHIISHLSVKFISLCQFFFKHLYLSLCYLTNQSSY